MLSRALLVIFSFIFLSGCAPTMTQHRNTWQAINNKTSLAGYGKKYFIHEFGFPYSKSVSSLNGIRVETWVYKTNLKDKYAILNMHPAKARYLKVIFSNGIASDAIFE